MTKRKFTWPPTSHRPQTPVVAPADGHTDPVSEANTRGRGGQHRENSSDAAAAQDRTQAGHFRTISPWAGVPAPRFPALHAAITLFEQTWLGLVRPTLHDRAREHGWQPDPPASYCPVCGVSVAAYEALDPLDAAEKADAGCKHCRGEKIMWERFVRLGPYEDLLREVVLEVKFSHWRTLGVQAGALLGAGLARELSRCGAQRAVLIPVPTHPIRRVLRGIDHTLTLARGMRSVKSEHEMKIACLLARRWRTAQAKLSSAKRKLNVKNSMYVRGNVNTILQPGTVLVVVDDVRTTGATLTEACRCLRAALGSKLTIPIWVAVVACAEPRSLRPGNPVEPFEVNVEGEQGAD